MQTGNSRPFEPLRLIIYSSWRANITNDQAIEITLKSLHNNWNQKITGAIWFGETRFFQVMEGESEIIAAMYQKIQNDNRHDRIVTHCDRMIVERHFKNWDSYVLDGPEPEAIAALVEQYVNQGSNCWCFL